MEMGQSRQGENSKFLVILEFYTYLNFDSILTLSIIVLNILYIYFKNILLLKNPPQSFVDTYFCCEI